MKPWDGCQLQSLTSKHKEVPFKKIKHIDISSFSCPPDGAGVKQQSVCRTKLVHKALAGLFPATSGAPLLPVLNAVNFTAFLGLTADSPAVGALLEPLLTHTDGAHSGSQALFAVSAAGDCPDRVWRCSGDQGERGLVRVVGLHLPIAAGGGGGVTEAR